MIRTPSRNAVALVAILSATSSVSAQVQVRWAAGVSGDFTDSTKWAGTLPNDPVYEAVFDTPGTYTVRHYSIQTLRTGSIIVDNPGASLDIGPFQPTRALLVRSGNANFSDIGGGTSLVNLGTGLVGVGANGLGHIATINDFGGNLYLNAAFSPTNVTFRDGSIIRTSNLHFDPSLATLSGNATVIAENYASIGPTYSDGKLTLSAGLKIQIGPGTAFNTGPGVRIGGVDSYADIDLDRPAGFNTGDSVFTGNNYGRIHAETTSDFRWFSGNNYGTIDVTAQRNAANNPTQTFTADFNNAGTALFTNSNVQITPLTRHQPGSVFRVTDGILTVVDSNTTPYSLVQPVERVRTPIRIEGELDLQGAALSLTADEPLQIRGSIRNGTLSGPAGSLVFLNQSNGQLRNTFTNMVIDTPMTRTDFLTIRGGLTLLKDASFLAAGTSIATVTLDGSQTISGTSVMTFGTPGDQNTYASGLNVPASTTLTIDPGITFRSALQGAYLGNTNTAAGSVINNRGTVIAATGTALTIGSEVFINTGQVTTEPGSTLNLSYAHLATLGSFTRGANTMVNLTGSGDLAGATLDLANTPAGTLDLGSLFLQNGTIVSTGRVPANRKTYFGRDGAYLSNVAVATDILIAGGSTLTLDSSPLVNATLTFQPGAKLTGTAVTGTALTGTGLLNLNSATNTAVTTTGIGVGITTRIEAGATTTIANSVFDSQPVTLQFDGPISATAARLDLGTSSSYTNRTINITSSLGLTSGTTATTWGALVVAPNAVISASANSSLILKRPLNNGGRVIIDATSTLDVGGDVSGKEVELDGTLFIPTYASPRFVTTPRFSDTSRLVITLANTTQTTARTTFSSPFAPLGTLVTTYSASTQPLPGTSFALVDAPGILRSFAAVEFSGLRPGYVADLITTATRLSIQFNARFVGDANLDNVVNGDDLNLVGSNFSQANRNWFTGDFSGDARTNLTDLKILSRNWQSTPDVWQAGLTRYNLPRIPLNYIDGDFNFDGYVDAADYTLWADTFGRTGQNLAADANNDSTVNAADYTVWADHFGQGIAPGSLAAAVPEPTAIAVVLPGMAMLRRRARR